MSDRSDERRRLGIPEDSLVVGSILRFGEEKRPMLWMEMARELHKEHPSLRFLLFGVGPMLENCRDFAGSNDLAEVTTFAGLTTDAWASLSAMDIFVLTSRLEGLPNVLVEAQAMGLPVVCSGTGGMAEAFVDGSTGFAVPSSSASDLACAVARLLGDTGLRKRMGDASSHHARTSFGIERMLDETLSAYADTPVCEPQAAGSSDWAQADDSAGILLGGAVRVRDRCFSANVSAIDPSAWELYEDDHRLRSDDVGQKRSGVLEQGNYRFEQNKILFCSSDGSDIRFNGRF